MTLKLQSNLHMHYSEAADNNSIV